MAKLTIDLSGREGLVPMAFGDLDRTISTPNLRYIGSQGQLASGIFNPFRKYGYICPANATFNNVTLSSTPTEKLACSLYDTVNNDYYFGELGPKLYKGDGLDDKSLTELGAFGASDDIMDLEIYQINGVKKMFILYKRAGFVEIATSSLPYDFASDDPIYFTSTVDGSKSTNLGTNNAFMRVSDNGSLYVFYDNEVDEIDGSTLGGTNGTLSTGLLFPKNTLVLDAIDYRGNLYIAIRNDSEDLQKDIANVFSSNIGIYIWDRVSSVVSSNDYIPVSGLRDIKKILISPDGNLRILGLNSEQRTIIQDFNGSKFKTVSDCGLLANPIYKDSVAEIPNGTVWVGYDGRIFFYGKSSFNEKEGIYVIGNISDITVAAPKVGAILFGGAEAEAGASTGFKSWRSGLIISYKNSSNTQVVKQWDMYGTGADGVTAKQLQGDIFTKLEFLPKMSTVKNLMIYFPKETSVSGTTVEATIKIYFNQSLTAWASKSITYDDISKGYIDIDINKPFINSVQLEIEYNTNQSIGISNFTPSFGIMEYEPTNTKG